MRSDFNKVLLGAKIAYHRKLLRITQEELAQRSKYSTAMIGQIEQGEKLPSLPGLCLIAAHLKVPVASLLDGCLEVTEGET